MNCLDYYAIQSLITNPGKNTYLFTHLPHDVGYLKSIIQHLVMHFWDEKLVNYRIPISRLPELETRFIEKMLDKLLQLDKQPLENYRTPEKRVVGSCSDYALLLCAMLRHNSIPARTRVAFSAFYFPDYFHDQIIVEYWNDSLRRWCLVDPRVTELHVVRQNLKINFDLYDVPRDKLILAGLAWKMSRENPQISKKFCGGNINKNQGLWYVRDRLIQDFAALNKCEMQLWDCWGMMQQSHELESDMKQLEFLDYIADITLNTEQCFSEIINLYQSNNELKIISPIISYSPVWGKRELKINLTTSIA